MIVKMGEEFQLLRYNVVLKEYKPDRLEYIATLTSATSIYTNFIITERLLMEYNIRVMHKEVDILDNWE